MTVGSNSFLHDFTERKEETRTARILAFGRKRTADVAHSLSRVGAMAATAELLNEKMNKLIALAFEEDETGPCNRDPESGRLLLPAPWGRNGRYVFGLRATEADVLRLYMQHLLTLRRPAPLFTYDNRQWYVNHFDYGDVGRALGYWEIVQLDGSTYRRLADQVQKRRSSSA